MILRQRRGYIAAYAATSLFGTIPVSIAATSANAYTIAVTRLIAAALFFLALTQFQRARPTLIKSDWLKLMALGVLFAAHWLAYFQGLKSGSAAAATLGFATFGIQATLLECFLGKQKPNAGLFVGVLLCSFGAVMAVPSDLATPTDAAMFTSFKFGVVSATFYALVPFCHQSLDHLPTATRASGQYGFALVPYLFAIRLTDWELTAFDWTILAYLAFMGTIIAHTLWIHAMGILRPSLISIISYLYVPCSVLFIWLCSDEPVTKWIWLAVPLIVCGNLIAKLRRS